MEYATKACELSAWKERWPIENLAEVCAVIGNFELAVKWQKLALELHSEDGADDEECRRVLKLYEHKVPPSPPPEFAPSRSTP